MNLLFKIEQIHQKMIHKYLERFVNKTIDLINQYHTQSTENLQLIQELLQNKTTERNIKRIQLNNYLFIIGRSLFGYIGTYDMCKEKIQTKKMNKINSYHILKELFIYENIQMHMIAIKILLRERVHNEESYDHPKKKIQECIKKYWIHQVKLVQNIQQHRIDPKRDPRMAKKKEKLKENFLEEKYKNERKDTIIEKILDNKNIWNKQVIYKKEFDFVKKRLIIKKIHQILNLSTLNKQHLLENWHSYLESIKGKRQKTVVPEGLFQYLQENLIKLQVFLRKKNIWKEHYTKQIQLTQKNVINNYLLQRIYRENTNQLSTQVFGAASEIYTNLQKMLITVSHENTELFLKQGYNTQKLNNYTSNKNHKITMQIQCPNLYTKNLILIQKIRENLKNNKVSILHIKTPDSLQITCKLLNKMNFMWAFVSESSIEQIKKDRQNQVLILRMNEKMAQIQDINSNLEACIEHILVEYIPQEVVQMSTKIVHIMSEEDPFQNEYKIEKRTQKNYKIDRQVDNNQDNIIEKLLNIKSKQSTSLHRLYKNYMLTRIELYYATQAYYKTRSWITINKKEKNELIFEIKIKKVINYIKKVTQTVHKKQKSKDIDPWYQYTYPIHIQKKENITHKESVCKEQILAVYHMDVIYKVNSSYTFFCYTILEMILKILKEYNTEIVQQKKQIYNKKYTQNIIKSYREQINNLNQNINHLLIEYISQYKL